MNNKGFTLIELIVTIVILSIVMSFGAYSIISIINSSNKKNYESLIKNIQSAMNTYAIECTYSKENLDEILTNDPDFCKKGKHINNSTPVDGITLGELVKYGYLSGNSKNDEAEYTLVNPKDNQSISDCRVKYKNNNGKITVMAISPTGSCPTQTDYNK